MRLVDKWNSFGSAATNVAQRIQAHGLPQYIGVDATGRWIFYSVSRSEPKAWPDIKVIQTAKREVSGGWQLLLTLREENFRDEFAYLCEDLVARTALCDEESEALSAQRSAFEDWIEFFKGGKGMTAEVARGLFGELSFINERLDAGDADHSVLAAWNGPFGAPQDFVFDEFRAIEIKTLQSQASYIRIANERQLSFPGALRLKVFRIQENASQGVGMNLATHVELTRSRIAPSNQNEFNRRLIKVGYSAESPHATDIRYSIGESYFFDANAVGFPKIVAEFIPLGVSNVEYRIDLSALLNKGFDADASE